MKTQAIRRVPRTRSFSVELVPSCTARLLSRARICAALLGRRPGEGGDSGPLGFVPSRSAAPQNLRTVLFVGACDRRARAGQRRPHPHALAGTSTPLLHGQPPRSASAIRPPSLGAAGGSNRLRRDIAIDPTSARAMASPTQKPIATVNTGPWGLNHTTRAAASQSQHPSGRQTARPGLRHQDLAYQLHAGRHHRARQDQGGNLGGGHEDRAHQQPHHLGSQEVADQTRQDGQTCRQKPTACSPACAGALPLPG